MTRDRGNYGPREGAPHPMLRWAADRAANEAVDYARDRTVGAPLRAALPIIDNAFAASRGANQMWIAARAIDNRHQGGRSVAEIGQDLVHTGLDRDRAIAQISADFRLLTSDLSTWLSANPDHIAAKNVASWIAADVTPALAEWGEFVAREKKSWWTKIATSWDTFVSWADRIKQFRALARAHGVTLQTAEPVSLPKTVWQRTQDGNASEGLAVLGVLKIGALAALGIMGAAGLYTAVRNLKNRPALQSPDQVRQIVREEITATKRKT